jgi:hypothetical protein
MPDHPAAKRTRTVPAAHAESLLLSPGDLPETKPVSWPGVVNQSGGSAMEQMRMLRRYIVIQIQGYSASVKVHRPRTSLTPLVTAIVEACRVCYASEAMLQAARSEEGGKIVNDLNEAMKRLDDLSDKELAHLFDAVLVENFRNMAMPTGHLMGPS